MNAKMAIQGFPKKKKSCQIIRLADANILSTLSSAILRLELIPPTLDSRLNYEIVGDRIINDLRFYPHSLVIIDRESSHQQPFVADASCVLDLRFWKGWLGEPTRSRDLSSALFEITNGD